MCLRSPVQTTTRQAQVCLRARAACQPPMTKGSCFNNLQQSTELENSSCWQWKQQTCFTAWVKNMQSVTATEEEILSAADVWPKYKQMIPLSRASRAHSFLHNDTETWPADFTEEEWTIILEKYGILHFKVSFSGLGIIVLIIVSWTEPMAAWNGAKKCNKYLKSYTFRPQTGLTASRLEKV